MIVPPVTLPFFGSLPHILKTRDLGREGDGRDVCFPSRLRTPVNKGIPSEKGRKGG